MIRRLPPALILLTVIMTTGLAAETISQHEPTLFDPYREPARPLSASAGWTSRAQATTTTAPTTPLRPGVISQSPADLSSERSAQPPRSLTQPLGTPIQSLPQNKLGSRWTSNRQHQQRLSAVQKDARFYQQEDSAKTRRLDFRLRGLIMTKDNAVNRQLAYDQAGASLSTRDADLDSVGGFEAMLSKGLGNDQRVDLTYWGLFTAGDTANLNDSNAPIEFALDLEGLHYGPADAPLTEIFDGASQVSLSRNFQYHNLELNWTGSGRNESIDFDYLAGFRYFKASESLHLDVDDVVLSARDENHMLGLQLGGLVHWQPREQLELHAGIKFGVFANVINHHAQIQGSAGYAMAGDLSSPLAATQSLNKDDFATLGQFDLGLQYHWNDRCRMTTGYRIVGINGLALPTDQLAQSLESIATGTQVHSNGSILLHGIYVGLEYDF